MAMTTSELMRVAMTENGITWSELELAAKAMVAEEVEANLRQFRNGFGVSTVIAAAIITLIVRRKSDG